MNPTAKDIRTTTGEPFPFNQQQRFTLPQDSTERVRITAAAMCAMIHHAAAIGPNVAGMARMLRDNSWDSVAYLWGVLKERQIRTPDPDGVELLRSPEQSAGVVRATGSFPGDCDDVAMLACAIAVRVGWSCSLRVIRRAGNDWEHVYAVVQPVRGGPEYVIDPQETSTPGAERAHEAALNFPVWRT